jgi:hypothetical protein
VVVLQVLAVSGCSQAGESAGPRTADVGQVAPAPAQASDASGASAVDAAVSTVDAAPVTPLEASVALDASVAVQGDAAARVEVTTEQSLRDMRPEFLDYLWNNLDAASYERWHPTAHETFAWVSAPKVPGDLGAEVRASYTSRLVVAGASREQRVVYIEPQQSDNRVTLESAMAADVWLDGAGPFRLVVQYQQEKDEVRVQQRMELPADADQAAWRSYLEERMTNLAGFIRDQFQTQYVDTEITKRGTYSVTTNGLDFDIVVMQDIGKLTPPMVDWWWDNMGETERYRHWHPTAHQTFTWSTPPKNSKDLAYDVGSVQKIVEVIGEATTLNITWLDPAQIPVQRTYTNFIYGQTNLDGSPFGGFLVHEYEARPNGGIRMKSMFRLPWLAGDVFAKALGEHCIQEMQFLQYYLPRLFAKEYMP